MSGEGNPFWASLYERIIGIVLIIIGAVLIYLTATSPIGGFGLLFGFLSAVLLIAGIFLLIIKPSE